MNRKKSLKIMRTLGWISVATLVLLMSGCATHNQGKRVIGETARIVVTDAGMEYLARIDTGARVTSIHALDMEVLEGSTEKEDNVGKMLTFYSENEKGESKKVTTRIIDIARVRNAQGVEFRYVVDLSLSWQGQEKAGHVNLRDRSAMTYKLLVGRNWLSNDFVVDVDKSEGLIK